MMDTRGWLHSLPVFGFALLFGACPDQEPIERCRDAGGSCVSTPLQTLDQPNPNLDLVGILTAANDGNSCQPDGTPHLISDNVGLFNEVDGAAPKYIDRGWVAAAFASYRCAGSTLRVAIHELGSSDQALGLFTYSLPVATSTTLIDSRPNTAMDMGLPTAYASMAHLGPYFYEASISDKTPAALTLLQSFTIRLLNLSSR